MRIHRMTPKQIMREIEKSRWPVRITHDSLIWLCAGLAAVIITLLLTGLAAWVL